MTDNELRSVVESILDYNAKIRFESRKIYRAIGKESDEQMVRQYLLALDEVAEELESTADAIGDLLNP